MAFTQIGIIGSGVVAQTLAKGFLKHGYATTMGTRDPAKLATFVSSNPGLKVASVKETAASGEVLVLAVKGHAAVESLKGLEAEIAGKIVIDTCNPIDEAHPPSPSMPVLAYFTKTNDSLIEILQAAYPAAKFVKAFNSIGNAVMVNPSFKDGPPTMFICGNDAQAKAEVTRILEQFGHAARDVGPAQSGRAIEPLCLLWCAIGFKDNHWTHAFKLLA
ncbi:dinucleotide-binding enzyme [Cladochytrium replicatum]|nr:dinucleotide-binding enzyme [Cladochytrium replicatum]